MMIELVHLQFYIIANLWQVQYSNLSISYLCFGHVEQLGHLRALTGAEILLLLELLLQLKDLSTRECGACLLLAPRIRGTRIRVILGGLQVAVVALQLSRGAAVGQQLVLQQTVAAGALTGAYIRR